MSRNSTSLPIGEHQRGADKTARIPFKVVKSNKFLRKPDWIRIKVRGYSQSSENDSTKTSFAYGMRRSPVAIHIQHTTDN